MILDVVISDVVFVEADIHTIINEIFLNSKIKYGKNARIFMYVYYDDEDIRANNWVARPTPINDFEEFQLNFNKNYHAKSMRYFNEEISINTIYKVTQPIVEKCEQELTNIIGLYDSYFRGIISRKEYRNLLQQITNLLNKPIYFELQSINHGSSKFYDYYNSSNSFCMNVIGIAEEQAIYIDRDDNDKGLELSYKIKKQICDSSWEDLRKAYKDINIKFDVVKR